MKITGQDRAPTKMRCTKCGYVGRTVLVVMTLAATHDDPAEYCWACPECMGIETLDECERKSEGKSDADYDQTGMSKDERAWL